MRRLKNVIIIIILLLLILPPFNIAKGEDYIKWLDFNASYDILSKCYEYDVNSFNSTVHYNFIELLSYITLKNGNKFNNRTDFANLKKNIELLNLGKTMDEIVGKDKYYRYYYEAYSAIFPGISANS